MKIIEVCSFAGATKAVLLGSFVGAFIESDASLSFSLSLDVCESMCDALHSKWWQANLMLV